MNNPGISIKHLLLLTLIAAPLTACKSSAPRTDQSAQPANAGIETTIAHVQQSTDYLDIPAHVEADPSHVVRIFPPLSGRILALRVLPGQEIRKGDVIAQLQSSEIAAARSDFEKAKIEVLRTDRALTRGKVLLDHEVLSQADYYELEAADQTAHSEMERARQRIHELGFSENSSSDEVALRSPISGVVLDIGSAAGEMQRSLDNATPIATIANIDSVWVVGDVFERDLASVQVGREVQIIVPAYAGLTLTGKIVNVGDALDPTTHTLKLRVVLPNPKHTLKTDMFSTIRIPGAARRSVILPSTAVLHQGEKTSVFVVNGAGKYEQRPVTIGRTFESGNTKNIEVLTGINDGDKVVTSGGALLRPANGE
ncbi:efflux RND transporter periplasmic adaptor subunit [Edaphobacter sp. 12200R-103]|uniref:efflux RND transporter periplasmic adaptor subunit n=1 Tax=Edaphobacter sp. 12200R-103 TaxID=2703788 RepID=UPI00138C13D2|nr:efflux RND transporter periplasmic adaptor subunit [Edaphobacter sp. 12200R-103]QHS50404.1 efflux RND transporter periplasmic adaptor subunit [Edaphobacter sp. 12200R-103]